MDYNRLSEFMFNRRKFDPTKKEDLKELSYFYKNNTWRNSCPFLLEWPHKDIISMCQTKYTEYMVKRLPK